MGITRREFAVGSAVGLAGVALAPRLLWAEEGKVKIRISARMGLKQAREAGLDGAEIGVGGPADTLDIAKPERRQRLKDEMKETGIVVSSLSMDLLNSNPLATDPRAPQWLEQTIDAAKDLGAQAILMAFFGKGSLQQGRDVKREDVDAVVARLKAAGPRAKDAGVVLGIENTLTAQQNAEIMERVNCPAVKSYYDVGNLTNQGYDVPAEIRFLKERIGCFHFKDGGSYLGEGKVKFDPIAAAMKEIGYQGWVVLETASPSGNGIADAKKNAEFIRKLFGMA